MSHGMIKALKTVGAEIDSLYNASSFHATSSCLTWSKEVINGDDVELLTRIDFRVFTDHTHPNERAQLKEFPYIIGFRLWWDAKVNADTVYMSFGLYAGKTQQLHHTLPMPFALFIECAAEDLAAMSIADCPMSPKHRQVLNDYYDLAIKSGWIKDVTCAFADQRTMIESCL